MKFLLLNLIDFPLLSSHLMINYELNMFVLKISRNLKLKLSENKKVVKYNDRSAVLYNPQIKYIRLNSSNHNPRRISFCVN